MTIKAAFGLLLSLLCWSAVSAQSSQEFVESLRSVAVPGVHNSAIGVTRGGRAIASLVSDDAYDFYTDKTRVLLIGGLDGRKESIQSVLDALRWFFTDDEASNRRSQYIISAIPCANPDGAAEGKGAQNASSGIVSHGYPPRGEAYGGPKNPEAIYLWRWIGMHAPDLVVDVRTGSNIRWFIPKKLSGTLAEKLQPAISDVPSDSLATQLPKSKPCETGEIAAIQVETPGEFLPQLFAALEGAAFSGPSPARQELQRRLDRTPLEVAKQLSRHYGHDLKQVVYIPALALIGRLRLGEITGDAQQLRDVSRIVSPYAQGKKQSTPTSGSALSGHLVFCELAQTTSGEEKKQYLDLARGAADLAFDETGRPKPSMPFHLEMSDSVFMGGPILARVGRLTGEPRYFEACVNHIRFMRKLVRRDDGLYRHSPLDEAAWGRGNGFPALGLAMCLSDFPDDHPQRGELLNAFREHLSALAKHQDESGMWRQVIDREESYRELSCTCMITFAMVRGVRRGWLEKDRYQPMIEIAWRAIRLRTPSNGRLVDVCTGTGKQKTLRDYYDRKAILGPDARGGAMALLAAVELASEGK